MHTTIDGNKTVLRAKPTTLFDFDVYNPTSDQINVYIYDAKTTGAATVSTLVWMLEIPPASGGYPGIQGKTWEYPLHLGKGLTTVARTVADGDPSSALRLNYNIKEKD